MCEIRKFLSFWQTHVKFHYAKEFIPALKSFITLTPCSLAHGNYIFTKKSNIE
jgi:hypothetical protein